MQRFRHHGLRVAGVVLLLIACVGYLIGYDSAKSAHKPAALTSSVSGVASLQHPVSWQSARLPLAYAALASSMRQPLVLSPGGQSAQAGLVVGMLQSSGGPLPTMLLTHLRTNPQAEVVLMVTAQAYRYRDLTMTDSQLRLTAYAVPTGPGQEALEICYTRSAMVKVQHECEQIAEGLTAQSEPVELTPYGRLVGVLQSMIPKLLAQRVAIRRQMHAASSSAELASLSARLAAAFGASASRLASLPPLATSEKALRSLIAALRAEQRAFGAYADDALAEQAARYPSALQAIDAAEYRLRSALESLALVGY